MHVTKPLQKAALIATGATFVVWAPFASASVKQTAKGPTQATVCKLGGQLEVSDVQFLSDFKLLNGTKNPALVQQLTQAMNKVETLLYNDLKKPCG